MRIITSIKNVFASFNQSITLASTLVPSGARTTELEVKSYPIMAEQ
nr:MAG TPA: hypothetical protein [Caudoviricetes sp.]